MLALALALTLQAAQSPPARSDDIVVEGQRDQRERRRTAERQVRQILPPTSIDQPLARFQGTLCPGVMGLAPGSAQAVVDRIGIVAHALGLDVGAPGCDANLLVIVTEDADATTRALVRRRPGLFGGHDLSEIRRIQAEPGAVRGWTTVEVRTRDGEPPMGDPGGPPVLNVSTASRVALGFRYDVLSAVVMIDATALVGRETDQIADYAVMRGLANARPERLDHDRTVLAAFSPRFAAGAPAELTEVDWGILEALYAGRGNRPSGLKRGEMVRNILDDDARDARP